MATSKKKAAKKTGKATAAQANTGPLPPYGIAIRQAIASGDARKMKTAATAARRHIKDVQAALDKLEEKMGANG